MTERFPRIFWKLGSAVRLITRNNQDSTWNQPRQQQTGKSYDYAALLLQS
jgi:hypothetical protein